jgi:hypothetical protein
MSRLKRSGFDTISLMSHEESSSERFQRDKSFHIRGEDLHQPVLHHPEPLLKQLLAAKPGHITNEMCACVTQAVYLAHM